MTKMLSKIQKKVTTTLAYYIIRIFRTSAVRSTKFGSILIFSSCLLVLVIYDAGKFFLNGRGPIILLKQTFFSTVMLDVAIFTLGGGF